MIFTQKEATIEEQPNSASSFKVFRDWNGIKQVEVHFVETNEDCSTPTLCLLSENEDLEHFLYQDSYEKTSLPALPFSATK